MKTTNPYYRHLFSRFNLRGKHIMWCINSKGWLRIHQFIIRWNLNDIRVHCKIISATKPVDTCSTAL